MKNKNDQKHENLATENLDFLVWLSGDKSVVTRRLKKLGVKISKLADESVFRSVLHEIAFE